jgi:hypothetical protein
LVDILPLLLPQVAFALVVVRLGEEFIVTTAPPVAIQPFESVTVTL